MKELKLKDRAPDFTLPDERGKMVRLSDLRGKKNVVLIFYPGDMTPGCTLQLCAIRDDWTKFVGADTVVFGINHADADSHAAFRKKYDFPFPLLIDEKKSVSTRYGAIRRLFTQRVIRRTVVALDKNGTIVYLRRGMPKDSDILKALHSLT